MSELSSPDSGLLHMIYPYTGPQQYLDGTLAYIEQARTTGGAVVIAAPPEHRDVLASHIKDDAVAFMDTAALGRNPGRLIPAWQDWIDRQTDGRAVHGINDAAAASGSAYSGEARYAEWLLNLAFAKTPAWSLLCPVDTDLHPAPALTALTRSHPLLWDGAAQSPVTDYLTGPYLQDELPEPPASAVRLAFGLDDLSSIRGVATRLAQSHGLPAARVRALTLAVSEVATNSVRYGGGYGAMHLWTQDGSVVCELRDAGVITDPLVGQRRPSPRQLGGRGLWFVHQLCDLVQLRSAPGLGTRIRLWVDLADASSPAAAGHDAAR